MKRLLTMTAAIETEAGVAFAIALTGLYRCCWGPRSIPPPAS